MCPASVLICDNVERQGKKKKAMWMNKAQHTLAGDFSPDICVKDTRCRCGAAERRLIARYERNWCD